MKDNGVEPDLDMYKAVVKFHKDKFVLHDEKQEAVHLGKYEDLMRKVKDKYEDQKEIKE